MNTKTTKKELFQLVLKKQLVQKSIELLTHQLNRLGKQPKLLQKLQEMYFTDLTVDKIAYDHISTGIEFSDFGEDSENDLAEYGEQEEIKLTFTLFANNEVEEYSLGEFSYYSDKDGDFLDSKLRFWGIKTINATVHV